MACFRIQTSKHTKEIGAIQKGADFVKAYALGFDVQVCCTSGLSYLHHFVLHKNHVGLYCSAANG